MSQKKEMTRLPRFEDERKKAFKAGLKNMLLVFGIGGIVCGPLGWFLRGCISGNGSENWKKKYKTELGHANFEKTRADSAEDAAKIWEAKYDGLAFRHVADSIVIDSLTQGWNDCKGGKGIADNNTDKNKQTSGNKGNNNSGKNNSNRNGNNNNKPHGNTSGTVSRNTTTVENTITEEKKTVESVSTTVKEEPKREEYIKKSIEMVPGYTKCYTNTYVRCK